VVHNNHRPNGNNITKAGVYFVTGDLSILYLVILGYGWYVIVLCY